jgi:hypothetical protein
MPVRLGQYGWAGPGRDLGLVFSVLEVHSPSIGLTEFERRRGRAGAGRLQNRAGLTTPGNFLMCLEETAASNACSAAGNSLPSSL